MTRSSEDIERDVEQTRAGLDETVEALKSKMSPGQLLDEITQSLKGTGASDMVGRLGAQVKENPMALAMIGAGMAWLMMGKNDGHAGSSREDLAAGGYPASDPYHGLGSDYSGSNFQGGDGHAGDLKEKASEMLGRVGDAAAHVKDGVMGAAGHAKHGAQAAGSGAAHLGQKVQRTFFDTLEQEPLVIGALGLAVGAAIGATLPSTRLEDRTFGATRDHLLDEGKARATDVLHKGKAAAEAAYEGARDAATQADGDGAGGSLVEKAEDVVRAGMDAAKEQIEEGRAH